MTRRITFTSMVCTLGDRDGTRRDGAMLYVDLGLLCGGLSVEKLLEFDCSSLLAVGMERESQG